MGEAYRAFKGEELPLRRRGKAPREFPSAQTKFGTVGWLVASYLQHVRFTLAEATMEINLYRSRPLIAKLGKISISELTTAHLLGYQNERKMEGASNRLVNMEIGLLRKALNWALDMELIKGHRVKKFPMLPEGKRLHSYLTEEEVFSLLSALEHHPLLKYRVIFNILTGLRPREIAFLEWRDIDLEKRLLFVRSKPENQVKDREERAIPLCDRAIEVLKKVRAINPQGRYVFSKNCKPVVSIKAQLRRAGERAGLRKGVFPYMLRHTFAVLALQAGVNLYDLKEIMGHSDISTTERYLHTNKYYLHIAVKRLDDFFKPTLTGPEVMINNNSPLQEHRKTFKA